MDILHIDSRITERYPQLVTGVVQATLDNTLGADEARKLLFETQRSVRDEAVQVLKTHPNIQAWKETYRSFGAKPKKHHSSIANLYRMIAEGIEIRSINPVVDIYNAVSIKHVLPLGGDDVAGVQGGIGLTLAEGTEEFTVLGGSEVTHSKPGEVIYRDDVKVLCRRWNWRECEQTKITEQTTECMLVIESITGDKGAVQAAMDELVHYLETFCGASCSQQTL